MKLSGLREDISPPDDANVQLMLKTTALDMCPWVRSWSLQLAEDHTPTNLIPSKKECDKMGENEC